jgi:hypothetical protein
VHFADEDGTESASSLVCIHGNKAQKEYSPSASVRSLSPFLDSSGLEATSTFTS